MIMRKYISHLGKTQEHILNILKGGGKITKIPKLHPEGHVMDKHSLIDRLGRKYKISANQIEIMEKKGLLQCEISVCDVKFKFSSTDVYLEYEWTIREEIKTLIENANGNKRRKESNV